MDSEVRLRIAAEVAQEVHRALAARDYEPRFDISEIEAETDLLTCDEATFHRIVDKIRDGVR